MSIPATDPHSNASRMKRLTRLDGRVAVITGATRGIGRECAFALARLGCNIVVAAKTVEAKPDLPGTIYSVAEEIKQLGVDALPFQVDIRDTDTCAACIDATIEKFGRLDILINNASALWWQGIEDTPVNKYDLITSINARGTFFMTKAALPHMSKNNFGRVINMSPPITSDPAAFDGHTAYNISKMGMTMVALGVASEYEGKNITGNTMWPATVIESYASINFKLGDKAIWRKATIIADATVGIICEPGTFTGNMLIDDDYLRDQHGFQDDDFICYRCDPEVEPPRVLAAGYQGGGELYKKSSVKRGDVKKLDEDIDRSNTLMPSKL